MNIWRGAACAAVVVVPAQIAWAGEQPLYAPAPAWVAIAKLPDAAARNAAAGPILYDVQQRVDGATVWNYVDTAIKLDTPEALSQNSNLTLAWSPDKGDLIVHQVAIIRDGEEVDALAGGQKFTVLRREQSLEQRELTGILSATLAVEGLRVGDVLRLRVSITAKDDALGGRAQLVQPIVAEPVRIASASYKLSWRAGDDTHWKALSGNIDAKPKRVGDFFELPIVMPVAKLADIPQDAPGRFQRLPLIEASTFASWADVSKIMAPLYATDGKIAPGSALAGEVATIKAATDDPLKRTAMALQLVQDKIRYLAVGMDGGNYVPQAPAKTWEVRYGDCKAKTLLLLAMLHAMDIEAEAVLAHADMGDLVAGRIPSALAFNHVIVGAKIGGETLWLDGTGLGTRLADLRDTPPFGHVLPVRAAGAELVKMDLRAPARPLVDLTLDADESTSIDLPSVIDLTMVVRGQLASLMTLAGSQLGAKEQRELTEKFLQHYVGEAQYETLVTTPDADAGSITIKGKGVFTTGWRRDDQRMERWLSRVPNMIGFEPDRARPAWADIPVVTPAPDRAHYRMRIRLPDGGKGYAIEGDAAAETQVAGFDVKRTVSMEGGVVAIDESFATAGREIPAAQIAAERDRTATLVARSPRMVAPSDARRRWNLKGAASASQLDGASAIFAKAAERSDEENVTALTSSASFHQGIGDYKGAIAALTKQIALLPSVEAYLNRSAARKELGDLAGALADAEEARKLDPASQGAVFTVAMLVAERGDVAKASALLDERIALGGKTRDDYRMAKATVVGEFGDPAAAIAELDALIAAKPGVPGLLNARCWIKATRNVQVDTALKDCTSAMELSDSTAAILDSRALVWMRLGRDEDALRDLDAALLQVPGMGSSRFLRAIVNKRMGQSEAAAADLAVARQMSPSTERDYARFGLKP
jgi:tetratricopeptide (TPR) repeat protein